MKLIYFLFIVLMGVAILSAQTVIPKKCNTCGKPLSQCQYKGKHHISQPKPISEISYSNGILKIGTTSYKMIYVQGDTFCMGATSEQGSEAFVDDEYPSHWVMLDSYYIGETEVTQALWKAVMGNNPSNWKGDNLPVEQVSWNDCQDFVRKLNQKTGKNFRLPTEAEWEFAARGGVKSMHTKYSGGGSIAKVAWYVADSGHKPHAVKTKQANELGIYDMSGNVWEWCQDWYRKYDRDLQTNPTGPTSGSKRVRRGGSWYDADWVCRVSLRYYDLPEFRNNNLGFRIALSE